jgi:hypothetical protein
VASRLPEAIATIQSQAAQKPTFTRHDILRAVQLRNMLSERAGTPSRMAQIVS